MDWKKGRGRLGVLQPLMGKWEATADSPMGKVRCRRTFESVLDGNYIRMTALWEFASKTYEEIAMFGINENKELSFTSFTSDGKKSEGRLTEAPDVHPQAICFEAQMPAGIARMVYWPGEQGFHWAVESKTKKGWNRFTEHAYKKV